MFISEQIRNLSDDGLAAVIQLIKLECKQALEEIDNDKLRIKIDNIDRLAFESTIKYYFYNID